MSRGEPDMDRLAAISDEMYALIADGKWTKKEYERLLAEAEKACAGWTELLGFIVNEGVQFEGEG